VIRSMDYLVVIPARYQSSRLPGKPLINICGIPMVVRTYQQCVKTVDPSLVVVATDDDRIRVVCESEGITTVMTSSNCLTGTDRVAEVAAKFDADTYINVQGDEPVFNPDDLRLLVEEAEKYPECVINGYCIINNEEQFRSPNIPKVVVRPDGRLLYMSRAAVPTNKVLEFTGGNRQVCAYAFPKGALELFSKTSRKTELEAIEDIEILRFLELGYEVRMIKMSDSSMSVDNPEDVESVEKVLLN